MPGYEAIDQRVPLIDGRGVVTSTRLTELSMTPPRVLAGMEA